jgi:asparagine synthase (glutamine-hydrolysing)
MIEREIDRVVDLTDPSASRILNMSLEEARRRVQNGSPAAAASIAGSFALVARDGRAARLARSLDRPLRYFLAKQQDGPVLVVSDRIDSIAAWLKEERLDGQFHPSYTRMVPAHHVLTIEIVGCPDPSPTCERFFTPEMATAGTDRDALGARYVGALAEEIGRWLRAVPPDEPIGVCFSGGVDSGAVFLVTYHALGALGMSAARLKAFTLSAGGGADLAQAREFLGALSFEMFLEVIEADPEALDPLEAVRVVEDYKPLDVESATMALALARGIRGRYPRWRLLVDGDGGDENMKDYPIEENPELTIRSVVNNALLYQEGWGVGKLKHSLTYTGGQSRSSTRSYAPLRRFGFEGFSPYTRPSVIAAAESIPFAAIAAGDVAALYALKGDLVARGVKAVTGLAMPVFEKRRFQHGAIAEGQVRRRFLHGETAYREHLMAAYR